MLTSTIELIVRYAETDQMGIVHHSVYPIWFEAGRTEFTKQVGISYSDIEKKGLLLPLVGLNCKYKGYAKYEDKIFVKTYIKNLTVVRIEFGYEVTKNGEPDLITEGETYHAWTDRDLKPINLKKHFPELYELFLSAHNIR